MNTINNIIKTTVLAFILLAGVSCSQDIEDLVVADGKLRLSISQVTVKTETRATPSALGKPLISNFNLKIQRSGTSLVPYEGKFVETLDIKCGTYDITATCGEDVAIGRDTPYYLGTAQATVSKDSSTTVNIPCRVANALLSVRFGSDEAESKRFDRFYEDYGVLVRVGTKSMAIEGVNPNSSIYFPAGSNPQLEFYGHLKSDNGRLVTMKLSSTLLPESLNAAEHAIVTLTLPDPESSLVVNISKVLVEDVTMDETIPLSWLPVPTATPVHQHDGNGYLVGTNVTFSNSYPGMNWKAVIINSYGEEVRSVEGQGELLSEYSVSNEWPYLPQGNYTALYYFIIDGTTKKISSRDFVVGQPQIQVSVGGYSSYTKYLEGDIDGANACNNKTIYEPYVRLHVSEELLNNDKYHYSFSYTYDGAKADIYNGQSYYYTSAIENQPIRIEPYVLKANAIFDGVSVESSKDFYITGLPVKFTPPSEGNGWKGETKCVTFSESEVKLGNIGGISTQGEDKITNSNFAVPRGVHVQLDYSIGISPATMGTTFSVILGNDELHAQSQDGEIGLSFPVYSYNGSTITEIKRVATSLNCTNSYGGGSTYTSVYSLNLKYAQ